MAALLLRYLVIFDLIKRFKHPMALAMGCFAIVSTKIIYHILVLTGEIIQRGVLIDVF